MTRRKTSRALSVLAALALGVGVAGVPASAAVAQQQRPVAHFVVLGAEGQALDQVEVAVVAAGGQVIQSWPQISVVVAVSPDRDFAARARALAGVVAAGATRNLAELGAQPPEHAQAQARARAAAPGDVSPQTSPGPTMAATEGTEEPLDPYQWNLRTIGADRAHEISGGSRDVLVGVLDTRVHVNNPDLAPNIDAANAVSCANQGIPDTSPAAWQADPTAAFAHGTAVSGLLAAARNGVGIAGVAPNVRIAPVVITGADGLAYPEQVVCAYLWAAERGMDVTNASFFADPWVRWCDDDPDQAAAAEAMTRAIDYAVDNDVVNVAGIGNANWDLSHPVLDPYSPVTGEPIERLTGNNCAQLPTEARGVLTVSGVGAENRKSMNSNYGIRDTDLTAPTGDAYQFPDTPDQQPGVLTPVSQDRWAYFYGTSASSPQAAGVVALIRSTHPEWPAWRVVATVKQDATRLSCPRGGVFDPGGQGEWLAYCEGGFTGRGFYGAGLVNALAAVQS